MEEAPRQEVRLLLRFLILATFLGLCLIPSGQTSSGDTLKPAPSQPGLFGPFNTNPFSNPFNPRLGLHAFPSPKKPRPDLFCNPDFEPDTPLEPTPCSPITTLQRSTNLV